MLKWMMALFNMGKKQNFLTLFSKKRKSKGWVWSSLLGLGVSALVYGIGRNRPKNDGQLFQNMLNSIRSNGGNQNLANLMEISNEIVPYDNNQKKND